MSRSGPNTSAAVMQQRQEARDSLDDFPTPPWAARALIHHVLLPLFGGEIETRAGGGGSLLANLSVLEPCCNRGHMARPLAEAFGRVFTCDVHDYAGDPRRARMPAVWRPGEPVPEGGWVFQQDMLGDFLWPGWAREFPHAAAPDGVVMNPPFRLAEAFIAKALEMARRFVAVFIRSAFIEGQERYDTLFSRTPPSHIVQFSERVILHKGLLREPGAAYWDAALNGGQGGWRMPSTATAYCWLLWVKGDDAGPGDTRFTWLPPCRSALERPGDYPVNPDERRALESEGGLL